MSAFAADLTRTGEALAAAGAVVTLPDGTLVVDPSVAPGLAGVYSRLLSYGYATGLLP